MGLERGRGGWERGVLGGRVQSGGFGVGCVEGLVLVRGDEGERGGEGKVLGGGDGAGGGGVCWMGGRGGGGDVGWGGGEGAV